VGSFEFNRWRIENPFSAVHSQKQWAHVSLNKGKVHDVFRRSTPATQERPSRSHPAPGAPVRAFPPGAGVLWPGLDAIRAQQAKAGRHVSIYWDGSIRLEVGVELLGPFTEHGEVVLSATPAGAVASATHFGPYSGLGAAHNAVLQWCRANNHSLAGPNWEIYGHWQPEWNNDPSQIRTDIYYQLSTIS